MELQAQAQEQIDTTLDCDSVLRHMAMYDYIKDAWRYGYGMKSLSIDKKRTA